MSNIFDKFDANVNADEIKKAIDSAPEYGDVPKGTYRGSLERMEVKPTKAGDKVMFSVGIKIVAPTQKNRWVWFNRIIAGNRVTDNWNDGIAIKGVIGWIKNLGIDDLEFDSYSQFANEVEEIAEELIGAVDVEFDYDADAFNPITIVDCFDI